MRKQKFMHSESQLARRRLQWNQWYLKNQERQRKYTVKKLYGISQEEIDQLMKNQDSLCAICEKLIAFDGKNTGANVDHCHTTNKVRGILCSSCNLGIGRFNDDITMLFKAINYLRDFNKRNERKVG
jgi:nitrate/TMAO reductase-like tetraheme cytochrome c subunit